MTINLPRSGAYSAEAILSRSINLDIVDQIIVLIRFNKLREVNSHSKFQTFSSDHCRSSKALISFLGIPIEILILKELISVVPVILVKIVNNPGM